MYICPKPRKSRTRRKWPPTPAFLSVKSHAERSLVGCSPSGLEGSDTTKRLECTDGFTGKFFQTFGGENTHPSETTPKNTREATLPNLRGHCHPDTKIRQRDHTQNRENHRPVSLMNIYTKKKKKKKPSTNYKQKSSTKL